MVAPRGPGGAPVRPASPPAAAAEKVDRLYEAGCGDMTAPEDDWPKELYRRLGFDGRFGKFLRLP
jgi:hypothetical protein